MKLRRRVDPTLPGDGILQQERDGAWTDLPRSGGDLAWLQRLPSAPAADGRALPFQPRSFRDCMLFERHWTQSSRGYARRFLPAAFRLGLSSMSETLVTADEILPRVRALDARVEINGRTVARTSTRELRWTPAEVLAHLSRGERLFPGELVASGTLPDGSGMETGTWLRPGDALRLLIEPIGEVAHVIE